jgi:hypothetical protein
VALLEKRRFLYNHSGDFPQVILIIPSHVPNSKACWDLAKNDEVDVENKKAANIDDRCLPFYYFYLVYRMSVRTYARTVHTMRSYLQGVSVISHCVGNRLSDTFLAFLC